MSFFSPLVGADTEQTEEKIHPTNRPGLLRSVRKTCAVLNMNGQQISDSEFLSDQSATEWSSHQKENQPQTH